MEKELLEVYGHDVVTDEGQTIEYSEQDICEQLTKSIGWDMARNNNEHSLVSFNIIYFTSRSSI